MTRFWTSDTHFGHARIIELCSRPFVNVEDMNDALVENWNDSVSDTDEVWHLGDVALGPWVEWDSILRRLKGRKILVPGNHDRIFSGVKKAHAERFRAHYESWFDFILPEVVVESVGESLVAVSHFPYDGDSHGEDRYADKRPADTGLPLIHGHTHGSNTVGTSKRGTPMFHVGVDANNYRPVSEIEIESWLVSL